MKMVCGSVSTLTIGLCLAAATWAADLSTTAPEDLGFSRERLARIGPVIKGEIDKGQYPGAMVLVARKGRIVYFDSFGQLDPATGKPMGRDAIFRMYSMTKPYTSVAIMMLMEDGKLRVSDPVSKFIPALVNLQISVLRRTGHLPDVGQLTAQRGRLKLIWFHNGAKEFSCST